MVSNVLMGKSTKCTIYMGVDHWIKVNSDIEVKIKATGRVQGIV